MKVKRNFGFAAIGVIAMLMMVFIASTATAALITYVDAGSDWSTNTTLADGSPFGVSYGNVVTAWPASADADGVWGKDSIGDSGDSGVFAGSDSLRAHGAEDVPMLRTTITELTPGASYNVYAYFQSDDAPDSGQGGALENADLAVGLDPNNLTAWSRTGSANSINAPALAEYEYEFNGGTPSGVVIPADGGDNLGVPTTTLNYRNNAWNDTGYYFDTQVKLRVFASNFKYEASLGVTQADANGEIAVYIDDTDVDGNAWMTIYDGVGYSLVPEPSSLALVSLAGLMGLVARRRRS